MVPPHPPAALGPHGNQLAHRCSPLAVSESKGLAAPVSTVLKREISQLFGESNPKRFNEVFLNKHSGSISHRLAGLWLVFHTFLLFLVSQSRALALKWQILPHSCQNDVLPGLIDGEEGHRAGHCPGRVAQQPDHSGTASIPYIDGPSAPLDPYLRQEVHRVGRHVGQWVAMCDVTIRSLNKALDLQLIQGLADTVSSVSHFG